MVMAFDIQFIVLTTVTTVTRSDPSRIPSNFTGVLRQSAELTPPRLLDIYKNPSNPG